MDPISFAPVGLGRSLNPEVYYLCKGRHEPLPRGLPLFTSFLPKLWPEPDGSEAKTSLSSRKAFSVVLCFFHAKMPSDTDKKCCTRANLFRDSCAPLFLLRLLPVLWRAASRRCFQAVILTQRKVIGGGIQEISRQVGKAFCQRFARWTSEISEPKSKWSSCCDRL